MRLFLAINLPAECRQAIHGATEPLRRAAPTLAWVQEPLLHLTLKFLGEQPEDRIADIRGTLGAVAARHADLVMELEGIGAFPNFRRPRTVWLGVTPQPRLELLHHDVEVAFDALGFEVEGRPFRPHLTLARVKDAEHSSLRDLSRAAKRVDFHEDVVVRSVDLMMSELLPTGPRYAVLATAALRST